MIRKTLASVSVLLLLCSCGGGGNKFTTRWLASETDCTAIYSFDQNTKTLHVRDSLPRGIELTVYENQEKRIDHIVYGKIKIGHEQLFVPTAKLSDTPEGIVLEREIYARTPASVISDTLTSEICTLADKGDRLIVKGYDKVLANGKVRRYLVECNGTQGYIYGKYTVFSHDEAIERYMPGKYDVLHEKVKDSFNAGKAIGCDFYPVKKADFSNKKMPDACYAFYLTISPLVLGNIDSYISLAKSTCINTFVLDIKDDNCPGYKAETFEKYSPTSFRNAGARKEKLYTEVVRKLHDEGFWVVGRITCFKDTYFVKDNPSTAITDKATGAPFLHNKAYWPSAYDRRVWQFNVELAKESIRKFGLDEINFDYVRFPDKMTSIEPQINYHNRYNESKVQAIQRFVAYAADEIHAMGAYISIDVFGETANPGYTTAYGQYWPALSNIVDVMCGMPYPDHFADHYYGISKPWNHPYEILSAWGRRVMAQQRATTSPAKVRTWVQCYHVMRYVDKNGIDYDATNVEKEIRGLYDSGLRDGYVTWLSSSNLQRYTDIAQAFRTDYYSEYKDKPILP